MRIERSEQQVDRHPTRLVRACAHGGQLRVGLGCQKAVAADHRHLLRYLDPSLDEARHRTLRHQVVEGDDRGRAAGQHRRGRAHAVVIGRPEPLDQGHLQAQRLRRLDDGPSPLVVAPRMLGTHQVGDVTMAEFSQMRDRLPHSLTRVDQHSRDARDIPVHQHQWNPARPLDDRRLALPRGRQHDPVRPRRQPLQGSGLPYRILLGVGDQHLDLQFRRSSARRPDQRREERVLDVRHHHTESGHPSGRQRLGGRVRNIAQLQGDLPHALDGLRAQHLRTREHPGHRGPGNSGSVSHLGDRHRDRPALEAVHRGHPIPRVPVPVDEILR